MGISAVDKLINIEKLSLNPSLKLGDKKEVNVNVSRDLVINQAYVGTASEVYPDLVAQQTQELLSSDGSMGNIDNKMSLTLSPFMGIVKSPTLLGTRIHLEFTITNQYGYPQVIKGVNIKLGNGPMHFKLFFNVDQGGSRLPDLNIRFPIVVNARGTTRLAIEFENAKQKLIHKGNIESKLIVLTGEEKIISKKFIFEVNEAMENTLAHLQDLANKNKSPIVFDAMIKS
ncbi:hypothetical protein A3B46_03255 [Candidatus Roizmanbacteria bacterium RIFCSPLOWO2_01_FULL_39_19]|nr:MAG: hypothetical protein A3B46_03255 [Candidatus Roizmanbacteria bacterium RIFCSPLOWO2_01_FULL_39_19]